MEKIQKEMKELTTLRDSINQRSIYPLRNGQKQRPRLIKWLQDVENCESKLKSIEKLEEIEISYNCFCFVFYTIPSPSVYAALVSLQNSIKTLKDQYEEYYKKNDDWYLFCNVRRVLPMIVNPSIEGQLISLRNLNSVINLLNDDNASVIGVWGMGGVGKTLLMRTLNDDLLNNPTRYPYFDVVIYITVSQPLDLSKIQQEIARRFTSPLDKGTSLVKGASIIYSLLKQEKKFLIIFEDVWETFNLRDVGVPQPEGYNAGSKVIVTSRDKDVCTYISKHVKVVKVDTLNEEESWKLLENNAGDHVVNSEKIEPIARGITRECGGLPLAIKVYGSYLRNQISSTRWECVLESLKSRSEPNCPTVDQEVFRNIKRSYNSFKGETVFKGGDDIQKCFLDCSRYPENTPIPIDTLVRSWHEQGFIAKEVEEYKVWYIFGKDCVNKLINVSLLEQDGDEFVKMNPLVRHVAKWIAKDKSTN